MECPYDDCGLEVSEFSGYEGCDMTPEITEFIKKVQHAIQK